MRWWGEGWEGAPEGFAPAAPSRPVPGAAAPGPPLSAWTASSSSAGRAESAAGAKRFYGTTTIFLPTPAANCSSASG
ncbi:hypothetical protein GCM10010301_44620 [Streptomyces plicatus]|nr:hypothetical protein GCM10010301_44620 [Streptomyces plicatus]